MDMQGHELDNMKWNTMAKQTLVSVYLYLGQRLQLPSISNRGNHSHQCNNSRGGVYPNIHLCMAFMLG